MPPKAKFYAVKRGKVPGVYNSWDQCKAQVAGFPGNEFASFSSLDEARRYLDAGVVAAAPIEPVQPKGRIIYSDGGMNRQTGKDAWGSVVDEKGHDLIESHRHLLQDMTLREEELPKGRRTIIVAFFSDVAEQQNNGAELLAAVAALRIAACDEGVREIHCDSSLIVTHWSHGVKSKKRKSMDANKLSFIDDLVKLKARFEARGGKLIKIPGKNNLADLGYHRDGSVYAEVMLKGLGPRAKSVGLAALCASSGINHTIDAFQNKDKVVFSIETK